MSSIRTNNIANVAGTASTDVLNVINGSAKAWVNFNGTGTVAIRGSYNVSSITDLGVGSYRVNYTTAIVDANYAPISTCSGYSADRVATVDLDSVISTSTQIKVGVSGASAQVGIFFDPGTVTLAVFR
jgi:hypothetical protein